MDHLMMMSREQLLEDFIAGAAFSILIFLFMPYAANYPDHLWQLVEAFLEIPLICSIILFCYSLGGIRYSCEYEISSHVEYFEQEGGYIIIAVVLILVLASLGSIFTAAQYQPLF